MSGPFYTSLPIDMLWEKDGSSWAAVKLRNDRWDMFKLEPGGSDWLLKASGSLDAVIAAKKLMAGDL